MLKILHILFSPRRTLLASPDLIALCVSARHFRAISAITCIASFLGALAVVVGYRALPFETVPPIIANVPAPIEISAINRTISLR